MYKSVLLWGSLLFAIHVLGQKEKSTTLGQLNREELTMKQYEKDTTATAVVLYEHANYYIDKRRNYRFTTDHYYRVKILKNKGKEHATISIPIYTKESVHDVKAITYNLNDQGKIEKIYLLKEKVFTKQQHAKWRVVTFTLPNVKKGSVIEYVYSVTSPYSQIDDWYFQSELPKLKSDFTAAILGNWKYTISVVGYLKLARSDAKIKKNCVDIEGMEEGSCLDITYGMDNIPAFKEEDYMLSKQNFISRLKFELLSHTSTRGDVTKYTKTWKDADKSLKYDFLDNQVSKGSYFKKQLPEKILQLSDEYTKVNAVYDFIKQHYSWNGRYWPSRKVRVKKAFAKKTGNVFDINLSLHSALLAANIDSKLVLTATRNKAMPTKSYPVISEFNYLVVKATIGAKVYFLDATQKNMPFGLVRFEALNGDGRVLDFEKGSHWEAIQLSQKTNKKTTVKLVLDEDGNLTGKAMIATSGYNALGRRNRLSSLTKEAILDNFESKFTAVEVDSVSLRNMDVLDKPFQEIYDLTFEEALDTDGKIRINPFILDGIKNNPFKLEDRTYPIDFGYPRTSVLVVNIAIPGNYTVISLPEKLGISLPNKGGNCILYAKQKANKINLYFKMAINKKVYSSQEYYYLKEFFKKIIAKQQQEIILIKQ